MINFGSLGLIFQVEDIKFGTNIGLYMLPNKPTLQRIKYMQIDLITHLHIFSAVIYKSFCGFLPAFFMGSHLSYFFWCKSHGSMLQSQTAVVFN